MSIRDVCNSIYNFFAWPFRKLYVYFYPEPPKVNLEEKHIIPVNVNLRGGPRRRAFKNKTAVVFFKPLFKVPLKPSKNDEEYKKIRDKERAQERQKRARENARREMIAKMSPPRPKPRPRTPTPPSDS